MFKCFPGLHFGNRFVTFLIAEKPLAFSNLMSDFDLFVLLVWLACGFFFSCGWSVILIVTDEGDDNGRKQMKT